MKKLFILFGVFLIFIFFSSAFNQEIEHQLNIEDEDLSTGLVISISPCALKPPNYLQYSVNFYTDYDQFSYQSGPEDELYALAPVSLPQGAIVKKFVVYFTDNDDYVDATLAAHLVRHSMATGIVETLASVYTSPLSASPSRRILKDETINEAQIKNHVYSYHLIVYFDAPSANVQFHGAKIVYY